jgi:manganese/zinc/iron transport system substrate-binding protein
VNGKRVTTLFLTVSVSILLIFSVKCRYDIADKSHKESNLLKIVTTTTMLTDLVYQLCGDSVELTGLMGAGVDPHLYKPTEGDVFKIYYADIIFYNGLRLEGRLDDLFAKMKLRGINTIAVADALSANDLISLDNTNTNFDPHIWFSINNWKSIAWFVSQVIMESDKKNEYYYLQRLHNYLQQLDSLDKYNREKLSDIPLSRRVLITAHDAFGYFGKEWDIEVIGLQGINTVSEIGARDVRRLADFIVKRQIPAIFTETSVSDRNIRALREAVRSRDFEVTADGTLFSDALGAPGSIEGTYIGMYRHNVTTIWQALK